MAETLSGGLLLALIAGCAGQVGGRDGQDHDVAATSVDPADSNSAVQPTPGTLQINLPAGSFDFSGVPFYAGAANAEYWLVSTDTPRKEDMRGFALQPQGVAPGHYDLTFDAAHLRSTPITITANATTAVDAAVVRVEPPLPVAPYSGFGPRPRAEVPPGYAMPEIVSNTVTLQEEFAHGYLHDMVALPGTLISVRVGGNVVASANVVDGSVYSLSGYASTAPISWPSMGSGIWSFTRVPGAMPNALVPRVIWTAPETHQNGWMSPDMWNRYGKWSNDASNSKWMGEIKDTLSLQVYDVPASYGLYASTNGELPYIEPMLVLDPNTSVDVTLFPLEIAQVQMPNGDRVSAQASVYLTSTPTEHLIAQLDTPVSLSVLPGTYRIELRYPDANTNLYRTQMIQTSVP